MSSKTLEEKRMGIDHLLLHAFTKGAWELLGEGVLPIARAAGKELLELFEKEGTPIEGNSVEQVLDLLGQKYKEFGLAEGISNELSDHKLTITVTKPYDFDIMQRLDVEGIKPFMSPVVIATIAALQKAGVKAIFRKMELLDDAIKLEFKLL
ncbi:MAG: hypothetical protein DRQ10_07110 [Candidatus Hydrothermota bacterium]|nr:MAG: hypothetical protein DRQ10_07110 [Candidatus Hydrothermae bacterium]